ncbi:MAG: cytochrome C oxidase subunit IV family protein [Longimicrobiales bacterium]
MSGELNSTPSGRTNETSAALRSLEPGTGNREPGTKHSHAKTYILIGLILTIITAVEVAIFYIPQLESVLVPILLTLSASKFVLVVLFYMHLRDDDRLFSRVFFGPLFLAILVVISLVILFKYVPIFDRF